MKLSILSERDLLHEMDVAEYLTSDLGTRGQRAHLGESYEEHTIV